jgi:hypothetical protein
MTITHLLIIGGSATDISAPPSGMEKNYEELR